MAFVSEQQSKVKQKGKKREGERGSVSVCMCVCERERDREMRKCGKADLFFSKNSYTEWGGQSDF